MLTILYVEDEPNDVFFLSRVFKTQGIAVTLRAVAEPALAVAYLQGAGQYSDRAAFPLPDIVLLDLHMPGGSGFDVLSWIRNQPAFGSLPVVIFSSSNDERDREMAAKLGSSGYYEKPHSLVSLGSFVRDFSSRWLQ